MPASGIYPARQSTTPRPGRRRILLQPSLPEATLHGFRFYTRVFSVSPVILHTWRDTSLPGDVPSQQLLSPVALGGYPQA